MAINFPNSPSLNELYTYSGTTWQWSGEYWDVYSAQTGYITSVLNSGNGFPVINSVTSNVLTLKSFSGTNITITDTGSELVFSGKGVQNLIIVGTSGNVDFTSIKSAVDSITNSSESNRYTVQVGPGVYYENEIDLTTKPYVSIVGTAVESTKIVAATTNQNIVRLGFLNEISFLTLSGASTGYAGIVCNDVGIYALAHKISMYDCDTMVLVTSVSQLSQFYGEYMDFNGEYSYGVKVISSSGYECLANIENYYNFPSGTGATIANFAQGSGATLNLFLSSHIGNSITGSAAIVLEDSARLIASSINIENWDYGIRVLNIGNASTFDIDGASTLNCTTYNLSVEQASASGTYQGSSSHQKIYNISENVYWSFLDSDDGEFDVTRKISVTFQDGSHTDLSTLLFEGSGMGLLDGGVISVVSGTTISVSQGYGYLEKYPPDESIIKRIDWNATQLTLPTSENQYIYFNNSGTLSNSGSIPNTTYNILLGRVVTSLTGVTLIDATPLNANHISNNLSIFNRSALGPVYSSGSIVTQNATPFRLNVSSGIYYFSENEFSPSGGTAINFTQYYRNGVGGWNTSATTVVNNTSYDGNGSLSALTVSAFTKHTLYVVGEGLNEKYFLVLGQAQYTNLVDAEGADLPTPPTYFSDSVTPIASIYIQQGLSGITRIEDIRPVIGFKAAGVSATALHANLLGLSADDHTQYLLVNGNRAMSGNLDMGENNIISAGTINNVTIQTHASRHQHGGADEVATVTPSPNAIPKADTNGYLDSWISDATTSSKGLVRLSSTPLSASTPIAVSETDSRFLNSISAVTYANNTLTFRNATGGTTTVVVDNLSGLTINGALTVTGLTTFLDGFSATTVSATTVSATTYSNLPNTLYTGDGTLSSNRVVTLGTRTLRFSNTDRSHAIFINASGLVGVNNSAPNSTLDVVGNTQIENTTVNSSTNILQVIQNNTNTSANVYDAIFAFRNKATTLNSYSLLTFQQGDAGVGLARIGSRMISYGASLSNYQGNLVFQVRNGTNIGDAMTIQYNGDVGIGTTTPTNKLHISDTSNPVRFVGITADTTDTSLISIGSTGILHSYPLSGITGSSSTFTGGTVTGETNFTGGLTANTISATTITATNYQNLPSQSGTGVSSFSYVPQTGILTITKNDTTTLTAGTFSYITGSSQTNNLLTLTTNLGTPLTYTPNATTGGTYDASTGTISLLGSGSLTPISLGTDFITAVTESANVITITKNGGSPTQVGTADAVTGGTYSNGIITLSGTGTVNGNQITGFNALTPTTLYTGDGTLSGNRVVSQPGYSLTFSGDSSARFIVFENFKQGASNNNPSGLLSFAQGEATQSSGQYSHSEGNATYSSGDYSHSEGVSTTASSTGSHAEGFYTTTIGNYSHSEGVGQYSDGTSVEPSTGLSYLEFTIPNTLTFSSNTISLVGSNYITVSGDQTFLPTPSSLVNLKFNNITVNFCVYPTLGLSSLSYDGDNDLTTLYFSSTFESLYGGITGCTNYSNGIGSHSEGLSTTANGNFSHSEGIGTYAYGEGQHVSGKYNLTGNTSSLFVIGNGVDDYYRSDIFNVNQTGALLFGNFSATTITATNYQNLPISGLTAGSNISVTGSSGNFTISFTGTTGSNFTGGTVTGATNFTNGLTANTISATTYQNLPTYVSAVTNNANVFTVNRNVDSSTLTVDAVTGGSFSNNVITLSGTGNVNGTQITGFTSGGEVNTASNLGSGTGLFAQKSGVDLQFKSITSTGNTVTITNNSTTINLESSSSPGGGLTWNSAPTTQSMTADNGYVTTASTLTTFTLPSTIAFGKTLEIAGNSSGLWQVNQNTGQQIRFGNQITTTSTGILSATSQGDCIKLICTSANTTFIVTSSIGNIFFS